MAAPAASAVPAPVPAPARSLFRLVGGGPATTLWDVVHDSPIISALRMHAMPTQNRPNEVEFDENLLTT